MTWAVLVLSAALEAVWASAMAASDGFSRPGPTLVFVVTNVLSLWGLSVAMRRIPIGTAYAVWTGLGAVLTVAWAALTGDEPLTWVRALLLAGVVGCVVGLKATTPAEPGPAAAGQPAHPRSQAGGEGRHTRG